MSPTDRPAPTVLVVENHDEVRDLVGSVVAALGWRPVKVASVSQALSCLNDQPVDAIISDWELDDGDGDVVLREAQTKGGSIPAVVISSYASPDLRERALAAGAIEMLAKPFRLEQLTRLLSNRLAVYPALPGSPSGL